MINHIKTAVLFLGTVFLLLACAGGKEPVLPPEVITAELQISNLSFREISLEKTIVLFNPNAVTVELTAYDSNLFIHDSSYKNVAMKPHITVPPLESISLTIPYVLNYNELYKKMSSLNELTESVYRIDTNMQFRFSEEELQNVQLDCSGSMPLIKTPRYRFNSLYVQSLGMMGADIIVRMYAMNPNSFDINLKNFQGKLVVNNENWSHLSIDKPVDLIAGKVSETVFQFRLEFLSMGKTVRDLLSGESELFYDFAGNSELNTVVEFLENETLALDLNGEIELYKPDSTKDGAHSSQQIEQSIEDNLLHLFGRYSR
ncbi:MAG: hypothetical protein B6241_13785 [Spirochaetaceae bacterium 4572_59]|nr:MAG: hypothetical protein B6241_13785 [Spirochaetaceae bacterium 4572_59]